MGNKPVNHFEGVLKSATIHVILVAYFKALSKVKEQVKKKRFDRFSNGDDKCNEINESRFKEMSLKLAFDDLYR